MNKRKVNWNMLYPEAEKDIRYFFGRGRNENDMRQLKKINYLLAQRCASFPKQTSYNPSAFFKPSFEGGKQFCTFKMNYSNKMDSHKKFLQIYMGQKNKEHITEKPILFGKSDNDTVEQYEQRMTDNHFKFMISPDSPNVPMKEFTRAYMEQVSKELNIEFDYMAAIHTDTGHPHAHILINGKDRFGNKLMRPFPPDFIKRRAHEIASDITTNMIGKRTKEQIKESYLRSFTSNRFTKHDERIKEIFNGSLNINSKNLNEDTKKRLNHLVDLKIAKFQNGFYNLENDWDKTLRTVGRYNSFLKARDELLFTDSKDLELFQNGQIKGVIRKVYTLNDEFENDNAIVIEDLENKKAYFVPLFKPMTTKNEGKICSISMLKNSKGRLTPNIEYHKENDSSNIER